MTATKANEIYNESFTEVSSLSDLKSVPSASAIASVSNSPVQTSNSESESENEVQFENEEEKNLKQVWPKFKRFRDPISGKEAIYELVQPRYPNQKGLFTLCNELVTLSSISLFLASNLFAFTLGIFVGKKIAYEF